MTKNLLINLVILFFSATLFSQKKGATISNPYLEIDSFVDKKNDSLVSLSSVSSFINNSFVKEEDKCRAIFYWVTKNISYAPDLMFTYKTTNNRSKLAKEVFENKTAVCIGYAVLIDTLCKLTNLRSFVIEGSTKQSFLPSIIGHAWNGVKINNEWKLIDATWGSGYLQNNKFIKKLNNFYFFPAPEKLITSHISVDPIWQMLSHPKTLYQFYSNANSTVKADWNYNDSINKYLDLSEIAQIAATTRRLNEFGTTNEITSNHYNYLKNKETEFYVKKLNKSTGFFNEASSQFNDYIHFKNKQFTPQKPDSVIVKIMPAITEQLSKAKDQFIGTPEEYKELNKNFIENVNKQIIDLEERVNTENVFIKKYLATKKAKRKELFYTRVYTVFGVPVK